LNDDQQARSFGSRFRPLRGPVRLIHEAILLALALLGAVWSLEIHSDLGIIIFKEQFLALIFTLGMVAVFVGRSASAATWCSTIRPSATISGCCRSSAGVSAPSPCC
jgi:hypothetical protein